MNGLEMIIILILIVAVFASIAGWLNTKLLLKDLAEVKEKLGIEEKEENNGLFIKNDLDN
ncbi:hypothetical protein GMD78_09850 [Ornithinibacillus sp. L9]|uniref:Uncharacterized protein n=1 Tax=Ornithinibacillus caprae TaxID=2678566 RepID=A0A6N8FK46_9BACI|nr:hypothetical protein [Ornithinibacillus caprae]MUK88694.1 hypothetical protein [Ornithinibacillus caprae]